MKKTLIALSLVAALSGVAVSANAGEVYAGVGTLGATVGYGYKLSAGTGVRVEGDVLNYSKNINSNGIDYDSKLKFNSVGIFADAYPMASSSFRVTTGIITGDNKLTGTATDVNGTFNINGTQYSAAGESLTYQAKEPSVMPYLGFGVGHKQVSKGLGFFSDVGVAFGKPKAQLTASPGLVAAAGQNNIDAEQQKLQNKLDKLEVYPVLRVGVTYGF